MHYPSIFCNETKKRHIVKDQKHCECGIKYNQFVKLTRKELRRIQFKQLKEITCQKCRSIID